ncbi:uncharacterized protein [Rutidosis leptorrhynchoides]|uniref:uncharacterized protein n=1 Tax=Rutidosis leptorrhynchoides TaxID=125765 RepID=UPI003A99E8DD
MEQNGESQRRKKFRISWKSVKVVETFLQACIAEIVNGYMQASSWKKVAEKLKSSHNFIVDRKQMKNHYDYLKSKYKAWSKLKNKYENVYDPVTNTFNLTEEEWEVEIQENKYVESLKSTTLLFPNLCAQLYDGIIIEDEIGESSLRKFLFSPEPISIKYVEEINGAQETSTSKQDCSSHIEPESPTKRAISLENSSAEPLLIKNTEEINGTQETSTSKQDCSSHAKPESPTKMTITLENSSPEPLLIKNTEEINGTKETSTSKQDYSSHVEPESPTKLATTLENSTAEPLLIKNTEEINGAQDTSTSKRNCSSRIEPDSPTRKTETLKNPSAEPIPIQNTEAINGTKETSTSKQNWSAHAEPKRPAKKAKTLKNPSISVAGDDMSKALKLFVTGNNGPSFKDCRDKLCSLGWGAKNPLHKMALVIFCESATYREAWMQLQADEVEDWVRMVGHKLRLAA